VKFLPRWFWLVAWMAACFGKAVFGQMAALQRDTGYTAIAQNVLHDWALSYREWHTEWLSCLYGDVRGDTVIIRYSIPADVKPSHSMPTTVIPQPAGQCVQTTDSLVGIAHNHPQTCRSGNGAACGTVVTDSGSMHPQDDATNDPCFESWPDIRTFVASHLLVNVVVCGYSFNQARIYVQQRGAPPNDRSGVCSYDPELDAPVLKCGKS